MSNTKHGTTSLDAALAACRRHRWRGLAFLAAGTTASGTLAVFLPNVYSATATVLVERRNMTESLVRPAVSDEVETRLHTISEEVLGPPPLQDLLAERVQ